MSASAGFVRNSNRFACHMRMVHFRNASPHEEPKAWHAGNTDCIIVYAVQELRPHSCCDAVHTAWRGARCGRKCSAALVAHMSRPRQRSSSLRSACLRCRRALSCIQSLANLSGDKVHGLCCKAELPTTPNKATCKVGFLPGDWCFENTWQCDDYCALQGCLCLE